MAPSTNLEPRSSITHSQGGTIAIAVIVGVGGAIILTFLLITFLLIWRRRSSRTTDHPYYVSAPPLRNHKSDSSVKPLLINNSKGDWDYREKFYPAILQSANEAAHDDRETISNNPNGLYHLPSVRTNPTTFYSPVPSSYCLPHVLDIKSVTDNHAPITIASERPVLPPLVIPNNQVVHPSSQSRHPAPVDEELSPEQPPSSSESTESLYSQQTNDIGPRTPPVMYVPLPLSQELGYDTMPAEEDLHRADTHLVGNLLKARARRNPDGLVRANSHVSHIERTGSIKSVTSISQDDRPYSKRYRSKKRITAQMGGMEVLKETSEAASLRSRADSLASPWDPSFMIQIPPRVAGPRSPTPRKA